MHAGALRAWTCLSAQCSSATFLQPALSAPALHPCPACRREILAAPPHPTPTPSYPTRLPHRTPPRYPPPHSTQFVEDVVDKKKTISPITCDYTCASQFKVVSTAACNSMCSVRTACTAHACSTAGRVCLACQQGGVPRERTAGHGAVVQCQSSLAPQLQLSGSACSTAGPLRHLCFCHTASC